jgi:hypothetical protein
MHVIRKPVGLATTQMTGKRRRVIVNCSVSKLDDYMPWNNETSLLY